MMECNHCGCKTEHTVKDYCEECYPLYCCENCGKFVDEQNKLCVTCWKHSDEYIED